MLLALLVLCLSVARSDSADCRLNQTVFEILDTEAKAGAVVGQLRTSDEGNAIDIGSSRLFDVPVTIYSNGSMVLSGQLTKQANPFQVACTDGNKVFVTINLIDTDNNPPVWTQNGYSEIVSEAVKVPHVLAVQPKATDADSSDSGQKLNYTILPGDYSDYFQLGSPDQTMMNITLVKALDYEAVQRIVLTLQVNDYNRTGHRMFTVNTTLTITVTNTDDVNPVWVNCTTGEFCYERSVNSNSTAGSAIEPDVRAVDGDLHLNAAIVYRILSQSPTEIVSVGNSSGRLTLAKSFPAPGVYTVLLSAAQVDDSNKRTEAKVKLSVIDTGYTVPVFSASPVNVTVSESLDTGQAVAGVLATAHLGRSVTYQLASHASTFAIHATSGVVSLLTKLDCESTNFYSVNVSASDGVGVSFVTVNVMVSDENEFNPAFTQSAYAFTADRRERGLRLGQVNATDADRTGAVTFAIPNAAHRSLFAVNAASGVVTLVAEGGSLPDKSYTFRVEASDGSRTASADVTVNFGTALVATSTAAVSTIAIVVLASVFGVIILAAVVASIAYKCFSGSKKSDEPDDVFESPYAYENSLEMNGTSQQDNPIEGYNNFMFGDEGADVGPFNSERDQSELFVTDSSMGDARVGYSTLTHGSIHTFSAGSSLAGSQRTLIPRQIHNGSQLQVVQVENAIDAASVIDSSGNVRAAGDRQGPGLTVYY